MALETRLGGANGVNSTAPNGPLANGAGSDDHHAHGVAGHPHHHHLSHLHMKVEPMNSSYFPTDASILTMGPSAAATGSASATNGLAPSLSSLSSPSVVVASATSLPANADVHWKVSSEEKDRYFAECRALRHELASAMLARRSETRVAASYANQLQTVVDTFQRDMTALLKAPLSATSGVGSSNEDLVALRQKLLEVNHALARQQTEILELKERETRHALPESQRVKWQLVMLIKKRMHELDLKALVSPVSTLTETAGSSAEKDAGDSGKLPTRTFDERLAGVRPSVFELLFRQDTAGPTMASAPTLSLDLDAKTCTQVRPQFHTSLTRLQ